MIRRPPDFIIGDPADPYLRRWWIIPRNRFFNIYLHHILRSDDDRALHDHPWWNISILLRGTYWEHRKGKKPRLRRPFRPVLRRPTAAHRLQVFLPVWSLFITGPATREWGFHCPQGWRHWQEFTTPTATGNKTGRGCT